jgi:hypothetical protein
MRRGIGVALVTTTIGAAAIAGCMIFTGSTDGYEPADSGLDAVATVDGACLVDEGGVCFVLNCRSTADCSSLNAGGDAGAPICCVGLLSVLSPPTIGSSCELACQVGTVQSCDTNADCSGGASCVSQSCSLGSDNAKFHACGLVPGCALVPSTATDAGATDAGATDTGASDAGEQGG